MRLRMALSNTLDRRVPGKVEAENYGHDGAGKSYSVVTDSQKSKFYRKTEPVLIEPLEPVTTTPTTGRAGRDSAQAVKLSAGEWTAYTINSSSAREYHVTIKAKPQNGPAQLTVSVGEQTQPIKVDQQGWATIPLAPVMLAAGENRLQLSVREGVVLVDSFSFE